MSTNPYPNLLLPNILNQRWEPKSGTDKKPAQNPYLCHLEPKSEPESSFHEKAKPSIKKKNLNYSKVKLEP